MKFNSSIAVNVEKLNVVNRLSVNAKKKTNSCTFFCWVQINEA